MSKPVSFNPEGIIKVLAENEVKYVLIGALAAGLQGFTRLTANARITPAHDTENLEKLANALKELNARIFTENVPKGLAFECTPENLQQGELWNLVTSSGRLDIVFEPAGTSGYNDLIEDALFFEVYGTELFVASLEDIIRTKKAADRPQDRQDVIILREILQRKKSD